MSTFLLILKILGILLSSASAIGSERLKKIEFGLRIFLSRENLDIFFTSKIIVTALSFIKQREDVQKNFLSESHGSLSISLRKRYLEWGRRILKKDIPRPKNQVASTIISIFLTLARRTFFITFIIIFIVLFLITMVGNFIEFLISLLYFLTTLLVSLAAMFITVVFLEILKMSIWVVSRPYTWFDLEMRKREIESTLVIIGAVVAIAAELLGNYYH